MGLSLHTRSVTVVHLFCTPRSHDDSAAHAVHSPLSFVPDAENVPGAQGAGSLHSVFAVALHRVFTPGNPHVVASLQSLHGDSPFVDHVLPATHGGAGLHLVSELALHADATPPVQDEGVLQLLQGAIPFVDHVLPATHGGAGLHLASELALHADDTPHVQDEGVLQLLQGANPDPSFEYVPATHAGLALHTTSWVFLHASFTPCWHVDLPVHAVQSADTLLKPELLQVDPSMHAVFSLHTRFFVVVHSEAVPSLPQFAQPAQGDCPVADHVLVAVHSVVHTLSVLEVH